MDAIGMLDEKQLIPDTPQRKSPRKKPIGRIALRWAAAALCLCFMAGVVLINPSKAKGNTISEAEYPTSVPFPFEEDFTDEAGQMDYEAYSEAYDKWYASLENSRNLDPTHKAAFDGFFKNTLSEFIGGETEENRIYSPLNVYMALSMLSEITDNQTRSQILSLLCNDEILSLEECAKQLWDRNYMNDGASSCILANSFWLSDDMDYKKATLTKLSELYKASAFCGKMGTESYDKSLQNWLNEQTGGLLEESVKNASMSKDTVIALASAIYFRGKWQHEFYEQNNTTGKFAAPAGEVNCEYMNERRVREVYFSEDFTAVAKQLTTGGDMWLILPDEGESLNSILAGDELTNLITSPDNWENTAERLVNLSLPKFDVSSDMDISEPLKALGVKDAFEPDISDYSPLSEQADQIFLSKANHAARVSVDEKGCTAAAYTLLMMETTGIMEAESMDFILDRPFIFAVTSPNGCVLFAGTVYNPN